MEEDDLILNFATTPAATAPAPVQVSGGRWKERRDAKLRLMGRERKATLGVNSIKVPARIDTMKAEAEHMMEQVSWPAAARKARPERPAAAPKKRVLEPRPSSSQPARSSGLKFAESSGLGGKNNTYVSSLFTAGVQSQLAESSDQGASKHAPLNAPLRDNSTFAGMGLGSKLAEHLTGNMKYVAPTKVQQLVAPRMMAGDGDLLVKAQTGSGKTLAFVLPIVHRLMAVAPELGRLSGLFAIIMAPTRELATQIHDVVLHVLRCHHQLVAGVILGGEKKKSEKARLRKGINILVATPGRLADHLANTEALDVSQVRWLVLDEGDRLVELGFEETVTQVTDTLAQKAQYRPLAGLPSRRVNVLCLATMPDGVHRLGLTVLENPEMVSVDGAALATTQLAPDQLVQRVVVVPPKLRLVTLAAALKTVAPPARTIVFVLCLDLVNYLYKLFSRGGHAVIDRSQKRKEQDPQDKPHRPRDGPKDTQEECVFTAPAIAPKTEVYRLHGKLLQSERTQTLRRFVAAELAAHRVLFCTDVASRGLDLPQVSHVVEYDAPFTLDDHLHRIGRSARAGNAGEATLFLLPGDEEKYVDARLRDVHPKTSNLRVTNYETLLEAAFAEPSDEAKQPERKRAKPDPLAKPGKWDIHATTWQLDVERWLLDHKDAQDQAQLAYLSHMRAYTTHLSSEREFFNIKKLHLGHLAKSFGLRKTPKRMGQAAESGDLGTKKLDGKELMMRKARQALRSAQAEFNY